MNKYDVEIVLKNDKLAKFGIIENLTVTLDNDYIDDFEDACDEIENHIWTTYGVSLHYGEDFEITYEGLETISEMFNGYR